MNEITISGFYDEISSTLSTQIAVMHQLGETYMCPRNVDGKNIADYTFEEFKEKIERLIMTKEKQKEQLVEVFEAKKDKIYLPLNKVKELLGE